MRTFRLTLPLAVVMTLFAATPAGAEVGPLIDFEPPEYVPGNIHGQDGWSKLGPYDVEVEASNYGYPRFGTQTLRISNAIASGSFGDQTFSKPLNEPAGESSAEGGLYSGPSEHRYFQAEWSFASTVPGAEQPGLQVVASPDRGDGARMSWVQMRDTPDGLEVNFFDYQSGENEEGCTTGSNFVMSNVASGLNRTVAHTIKITMLFKGGPRNDLVQVSVDGRMVHTGTSWEDYFRECEHNPTRTVDSILFRVGGLPAPLTLGNGFVIDNLRLCSARTRGGC